MKTIGLIGGMSWESTIPYYRHINETVKERLGGLHSARIVLVSVDFHDIEALMRAGNWDAVGSALAEAARTLAGAGADLIVLATNTMHRVAESIAAAVDVPLLHIVDPTAQAIKTAGLGRIGLIGTRFTMEEAFYRERLETLHGIDAMVPDEADRALVHRVIFEELCLGVTNPQSRDAYRAVMRKLVSRGAQGIILGCTEFSLLICADDAQVPLFDTTARHARAAADAALGNT